MINYSNFMVSLEPTRTMRVLCFKLESKMNHRPDPIPTESASDLVAKIDAAIKKCEHYAEQTRYTRPALAEQRTEDHIDNLYIIRAKLLNRHLTH
jgi:hypothetical protein